MHDPQPTDISTYWPIPTPISLGRPERGTNSDVWIVVSANNRWYLKRITDQKRWLREHAIRTALKHCDLPFGVPVTVPTRSGQPVATINGEDYELTAHIPGRPPEVGNLDETRISGRALGQLDEALATLGDLPISRAEVAMPFPDRHELATAFPDHPNLDAAAATLERIESTWGRVSEKLPRQMLHADPYPTNMLIENGTVRGIIDFEFCAEGHRVFELAAAMRGFALRQPMQAYPLPMVRALAQGYLSALPLTHAELDALPLAIVHREALSIAHWTQHLIRGEQGKGEHQLRIDDLLLINRWITTNTGPIREALDF